MRNGDLFDAFEGLCAGGYVVDGVKYLGAVVAKSTRITNANGYSFKDNEALFMLESRAVDFFRANGAFAVIAHVTVKSFLSGIS